MTFYWLTLATVGLTAWLVAMTVMAIDIIAGFPFGLYRTEKIIHRSLAVFGGTVLIAALSGLAYLWTVAL